MTRLSIEFLVESSLNLSVNKDKKRDKEQETSLLHGVQYPPMTDLTILRAIMEAVNIYSWRRFRSHSEHQVWVVFCDAQSWVLEMQVHMNHVRCRCMRPFATEAPRAETSQFIAFMRPFKKIIRWDFVVSRQTFISMGRVLTFSCFLTVSIECRPCTDERRKFFWTAGKWYKLVYAWDSKDKLMFSFPTTLNDFLTWMIGFQEFHGQVRGVEHTLYSIWSPKNLKSLEPYLKYPKSNTAHEILK